GIEGMITADGGRFLPVALAGVNAGTVWAVLQISLLWLHWSRRRREYDALCRPREDADAERGAASRIEGAEAMAAETGLAGAAGEPQPATATSGGGGPTFA